MAPEILDLNALAPEHPLARIRWATLEDEEGAEPDENGKVPKIEVKHEELFELVVPEDFGAVEMARMGRLFHEHDQLWEADKRTKAEDTRLEKLLVDITRKLIPDAPAEAIKALPALTKRGLAVRFFVEAGLAARPTMSGMESKLSALANATRDSADSTEEASETG